MVPEEGRGMAENVGFLVGEREVRWKGGRSDEVAKHRVQSSGRKRGDVLQHVVMEDDVI